MLPKIMLNKIFIGHELTNNTHTVSTNANSYRTKVMKLYGLDSKDLIYVKIINDNLNLINVTNKSWRQVFEFLSRKSYTFKE